jgi:hypothetical protein
MSCTVLFDFCYPFGDTTFFTMFGSFYLVQRKEDIFQVLQLLSRNTLMDTSLQPMLALCPPPLLLNYCSCLTLGKKMDHQSFVTSKIHWSLQKANPNNRSHILHLCNLCKTCNIAEFEVMYLHNKLQNMHCI